MRAAVVTGPGREPVCAEFAEPVAGPGTETAELVGAGLHPLVRSLAAGRHYGSDARYPQVAGVDAVARAVHAARLLGADRVVAAGRAPDRLVRLAEQGATTVDVAGSVEQVADGLRAALDGDAPSLVLDYLWGPVAEAAFAALARQSRGDDEGDVVDAQLGSPAGPDARLPAALLRSRRIRVVGGGAGSVSRQRVVAEAPTLMAHLASGAIPAPYTAYPLAEVGWAWAHPGPSRAVLVP